MKRARIKDVVVMIKNKFTGDSQTIVLDGHSKPWGWAVVEQQDGKAVLFKHSGVGMAKAALKKSIVSEWCAKNGVSPHHVVAGILVREHEPETENTLQRLLSKGSELHDKTLLDHETFAHFHLALRACATIIEDQEKRICALEDHIQTAGDGS